MRATTPTVPDSAPVTDPGVRATAIAAPLAFRRGIALAAVALALVLHVVVSLSATWPSFPYDEITVLEMSELLSGAGDVTQIASGGYYPGWSIVIAPLWWFTSDPSAIYAGATWIGVLVAMLTIWPLSRIVARLGLGVPESVAVAAIVMCIPSRTLQADYVMSEKLLFLVVCAAVLAAWRASERPTPLRAALFSLCVVSAFLIHARALPLTAVAVIWLLALPLPQPRSVRRWGAALVGIAVVVGGALLVQRLSNAVNVALIEGGAFAQTDGFFANLADTRPSLILRALFGQLWYQLVASLGLVAIGAVVLVVLCWREVRARRLGPACFVFGIAFVMLVLSVLAWSSETNLYFADWRRLDAWIYGRYLDPFTDVLIAIGLAAIVRGASRRLLVWAGGLSIGVLAVAVLWVARTAPTWAFVTPAHIPGVMQWAGLLPSAEYETPLTPTLGNENRFWLIGALSVVVALAVVLVWRKARAVLVVLIAVAFAVSSIVADRASDDFRSVEGGVPGALSAVEEIESVVGPVDEIDFDRECRVPGNLSPQAQNYLSYWLNPRALDLVYPSTEDFDADLVLACTDWPLAEELGAIRVPDVEDWGTSLWVLPGDVQDELLDAGILP